MPIFLDYSKAELDRNFDQRGWVGTANAEASLARCAASSEATRRRRPFLADLRYGAGADQTLDIFTAERTNAPVAIFVHGGAWKNLTKNDASYVADGLVPAGMHVAILNFTNLPAIRLPGMVEQVRDGIAWVYCNARSFGGDPERLTLVGHSSGAHLSAMALATDWRASRQIAANVVKNAALACGVYDLEPVMLSARSSYIRLEEGEEAAFSPMRQVGRIPCPVLIAYADGDTDEFQRQSREFAARLEGAGRLSGLLRVPSSNHFELMESFGSPASMVTRAILEMMQPSLQRA